MPLEPHFAFTLEYVSDVEAARRFYEEVLGLKVERSHPTFVQFDRFALASDEAMSGSAEPELYWAVEDADAAFAELSGKAEVSMPMKQMPFGKVFAVRDPAGRARYLIEFARERPSEVV
jgi:predicted enzyme related to lactoylglutathione lyase